MSTAVEPGIAMRSGPLSFRHATLDDAAWVADIQTERFPDEPADPLAMRHWWASDDPAWTNERYIIERDGERVGYAWHMHAPWDKLPDRYARVGAMLRPAFDDVADELLGAAYDAVEERARADGGRTFVAGAREDREPLIRLLLSRGYAEKRRSKAWELDLATHRDRLLEMCAASRERMRREGIRVLTIDQDDDPAVYRKLHDMSEEAAEDVPTTVPHVRESFEQFMRWFESPSSRRDRFWIAREGDEVVGISVLAYPPVRGNVWTDWTGTARRVRGRGVARALKLETVAQAIELGVKSVRTANDGENAPILHLNEEMGYTRIPGNVQLHCQA